MFRNMTSRILCAPNENREVSRLLIPPFFKFRRRATFSASTCGNSIRPLDWRDTRWASAAFYVIGTAVFAACAWAFLAR